MSEKYYEARIKCDVLNELRKMRIINSRTTIASEYVLGSTGRRADLACYNGKLSIGVEIKSSYDTLSRLQHQMAVYTSCFDEVMLVVDERHAKQALDEAPQPVSVFQMSRQGRMSLLRAADGSIQKSKSVCLKLLTMSDLRKLLGVPSASPAKKQALLRTAAELPDEIIFDWVMTAFVQSFGPTSDRFWDSVGRKKITYEAMALLSRFAPARRAVVERAQDQLLFWEAWRHHAKEALQAMNA
ncbi:sce7726 family protein [Mesorhizobium sp. WSM4906]|uniref:sce7726 family protein n=1 Tax=Mesorhizobium sp. WSM4906 TaxID=3038546 RepID=UPI0024161467|nr:sce7726 family protein [Mesorhizobium sp. WSM4906]WFP73383.1 sce7726 family protein [Mesorhizobium sp. WSM4906]